MSENAPADLAGSDAILDRLLRLHPKIIDLTLERVLRLLGDLGNPERALAPVVHIAGTNGKGSVLAMMRAGLEAGGAGVQAYTSPHLARFHERIRLTGGLIPETDLARVLAECEAVNRGRPITYFEITTVAALLAFSRQPADWTLLEVGLGGRLDATNVIDRPALTVITPVDYDHQQYLGETLTEIAGEKAGILKPGVPCVVGPQPPEAMAAIRARAETVGAPLLVFGEAFEICRAGNALRYEDRQGTLELPLPRLPGAHQIANGGVAVAALRALGTGAPAAALASAEWPARMQRLARGPLVDALVGAELWLDGGHNPAAGAALAAVLSELRGGRADPVWLIAGMLETKDVGGYLRSLAPEVAGVVTLTIPDADASLSAEALAEVARAAGLPAIPAGSVSEAAEIAARQRPGRVVICGSLYLAGHILKTHA